MKFRILTNKENSEKNNQNKKLERKVIESLGVIAPKKGVLIFGSYQKDQRKLLKNVGNLVNRKGYAPIHAFDVMNEVADWLGATGYTKEYPIEMGIRGVRSYSIGAEGTMNIMRIIISREILGKEFLPYK